MKFFKTIWVIFYVTVFHVYSQKVYGSNLLNSYLPASMQALAYYIDLLQYEPLSTTTVEPPFIENLEHNSSTSKSTTVPPFNSITQGWLTSSFTTTHKPLEKPTPAHKPAIYAPKSASRLNFSPQSYNIFNEMGRPPVELNNLTLLLIQDITTERDHDEFNNDIESLDNFLRLYDDNYGRSAFDIDLAMDRWSTTSTAGKKRTPPTKPYVEFLLVYDLLKRDAKSSNLNKYDGYSDEFLKDLSELSYMSSQRQLYTLFKRMLDRGDIQRFDVVSRVKGIIKDLGNPNSDTVKALRYIPSMPFLQ